MCNERRQPIINTIVLMQASPMARREGSHIMRCCEQAAWAAFQLKTRISLVNDPFSMSASAIWRQSSISNGQTSVLQEQATLRMSMLLECLAQPMCRNWVDSRSQAFPCEFGAFAHTSQSIVSFSCAVIQNLRVNSPPLSRIRKLNCFSS
jgi:hypothetical protein